MNKSKKILVLTFAFVIILGFVLYIMFFKEKFGDSHSPEKSFKSFVSAMDSVELDDVNIVLFTIDTLRADHLECYGYDKLKTPNINRLADEGILFENNITQTPLTLPSHSSIFTGTNPVFHGIRDNGGFYLEENQITLAEVLTDQGYFTGAFISAFVLDSRWGLNQGFDYYFDNFDLTKFKRVTLDSVQRRGDEVLAEAYKWLDEKSQQKFFAWIHLYDVHTPYDPPEPYKTQFGNSLYGLYDGEIAYVDQLMGEFRDFMENKMLLDKTLIIFTGDHGESLGEHKESAHGFFIYNSDIRVPLIMRFPKNKLGGRRIPSLVRSIDIMPTVLQMVGSESPESVQGVSLLPLIMGRGEPDELLAYSETYWPRFHYGWSELKSLQKGRYKFIDAPKPELYDILEDPGEKNNLVNQYASLSHEMKRELDTLLARYSADDIGEAIPQKIDGDSLEKLQALGYLGSFHTSAKDNEGVLSDPKDKIELYNEIKLAQFLFTEEEVDKAEKKIVEILKEDESILEARFILGNIYYKQEKYDNAIEEYKKALEVDSEYYDAIFGLASAYKMKGNFDDAILGFERLMELDSKDTKPRWDLGDIYLDNGDLDKALFYMKVCVELDPEAPAFHNKLGAIYIKKGLYDLAEQEIKLGLNIERSIPLRNAHFNLALIHEAKGEFESAISEYKKEQETNPFNHNPDFNLGLLYTKAKKFDLAIKEFESCIEKNENFAEAYVFLAKTYLNKRMDLERAEEFALKGLSLEPNLEVSILAHFVLADVYNRLGKPEQSRIHVIRAKSLQEDMNNR